MKIEHVMNREVHTCRPDQSLNDAAQLFWEKDCGSVPVVDAENKLIGMLTDRDVCLAAYFRGESLRSLSIGDTMARNVLSVRRSDELEDALDLMRTHQIRRLPVIDANGRIEGILSLSDLMRFSARTSEIKPKKLVRTFATICGWREEKRSIVLDVELTPAVDPKASKKSEPSPAIPKPKKSAPKSKKSRAPIKRSR